MNHRLPFLLTILALAVSILVPSCAAVAPKTEPVSAGNLAAWPLDLAPYEFRVFILSNHHEPLADTAPGWWKDAVLYHLYIRSFQDSNGDGTGDLPGLISRLDYITNVGFDAIWTLPIHPAYNEGGHGRMLGYEAIDYRAIHPDFGTMADFKRYTQESKKRGIRVVLDLVINHSARQNPWFIASENRDPKYSDWYIWRDGDREREVFTKEGWTLPWGGGRADNVWHWSEKRKQFFYATWGAEPNFYNPQVRQEFKDIAAFWLTNGVDGYRMDAIRYLIEEGPHPKQADTESTLKYLEEFQAACRRANPEAMTLGEVWTGPQEIAKYYRGGKALDQCFDFEFQRDAAHSVKSGYASQILRYLRDPGPKDVPREFYSPFIDNHDMERFMLTSAAKTNWGKARQGAALLLTGRGMPTVYYGSEVGLIGRYNPMQWDHSRFRGFTSGEKSWIGIPDSDPVRNVEAQLKDPHSLLSVYKRLIALRKAEPALRRGSLRVVPSDSRRVVAYLRPGPERSVLVVVNLADVPTQTKLDLGKAGLDPARDHRPVLVPLLAGQGKI